MQPKLFQSAMDVVHRPQAWETQTAECEGFQTLDLVTEAQPDLDSNPNYGVNLQRLSCRVLSGLWSSPFPLRGRVQCVVQPRTTREVVGVGLL